VKKREAGVTLIEVLIAVTLLSMLSVAMLFAMRTGLNTYIKATDKLMDNRRLAGAHRVLTQQIEGLMPISVPCAGTPQPVLGSFSFFEGESQSMRFVTAFSLQGGWRGQPQIDEFAVVPGEEGRGVRLVVNELPYSGPIEAGRLCTGAVPDPVTRFPRPQFAPVTAGPASFVLADQLEYCRISYYSPGPPVAGVPVWTWNPQWAAAGWPRAIRIEMAPLAADPSRVQPITVVAPLRLRRNPELTYVD
jgi:prepilin-type N-terminal cleavage/methylation domain-containing protein